MLKPLIEIVTPKTETGARRYIVFARIEDCYIDKCCEVERRIYKLISSIFNVSFGHKESWLGGKEPLLKWSKVVFLVRKENDADWQEIDPLVCDLIKKGLFQERAGDVEVIGPISFSDLEDPARTEKVTLELPAGLTTEQKREAIIELLS